MTPDQKWLSVWLNCVPGELLFLLIPCTFRLTASSCLHVRACPQGGQLLSLADTWTPWWGSSLHLLMTVGRDAECWRKQALCIDWVYRCIRWLCMELHFGELWPTMSQPQPIAKTCVVDQTNGLQSSKLSSLCLTSWTGRIQHCQASFICHEFAYIWPRL